jgi:hypothetical protein
MNTHKALGLLAAILVTAGQALVFAAGTSAQTGDNGVEASAVVAQADRAAADRLAG